MTERETAARLRGLKDTIHGSHGNWGADDLEDAVVAALGIARPPGIPDEFDATSASVGKAAINVDHALNAVKRLRTMVLPAAWSGEASVSAGAALKALERILERAGDTFAEAKRILADNGQALSTAHSTDRRGIGPLETAREKLRGHTGLLDFTDDDLAAVSAAHSFAVAGIDDRSKAADSARDSAERTADTLKELAGAARLQLLSGSSMDPLSELLISGAGGSGEADELILTPVMADRAREAIDRLSPADRQNLDRLLTQARSPEEAAYLMKALAAGHSMAKVEQFAALIHDHGDDPAWLKDRLSPLDTAYPGSANRTDVPWTQGNTDQCVAASNVAAKAQVDPIYALQLTTGGHPDDPAHDNPQAFGQRLRDETERVYDQGRGIDIDLFPGMRTDQSEDIANENIRPNTGVSYENQDLDNADERREALQKAKDAVDRGIPVPFGTPGHEMVIIGRDGDLLQVYNPNGYTVWIKESDFVNGTMVALGQGHDPPTDIRLPK